MSYNIEYAYTSNIGKVRKNHEDNYWCAGDFMPVENNGSGGIETGSESSENIPAFAVFDGMGGESCGEIAAGLAADAFDRYYKNHKKEFIKHPDKYLMGLGQEMNNSVLAYAHDNRIGSMGSTSAAVIFGNDWYASSNLGDSRIYELKSGKLRQISTDHVFNGGIYRKPPLVQYLGLEEEDAALEPSFTKDPLTDNLRILICSDGVTDMIDDALLEELLSMPDNVEVTAEKILKTAL